MNIVSMKDPRTPKRKPTASKALFEKMESSLKKAHINFEHSLRMAKTLAPILKDQTSNERHMETIRGSKSLKEKVIAIIMLGFSENRHLLPFLRNIFSFKDESLKIAAAISIAQMADGKNNDILCEILLEEYRKSDSHLVKQSLKKGILSMTTKKNAQIIEELSS